MDMAQTALAGAGVGLMLGVTGVGAGSVMTPLLVGVFGASLPVAIGTDLWFATITKASGAAAHWRQGHVHKALVLRLLAGSVSAALLTTFAMRSVGIGRSFAAPLSVALGVALLLTALAVLGQQRWQRLGEALGARFGGLHRPVWTVLLGAVLGVLVTLSSVGAGAVGSAVLLLLHPGLAGRRLVGSDIAHAVPLTFVAGLGHAALGHVDWHLLGGLLLGSVPAIWLGSHLTHRLPERVTRALLSAALVAAGLRFIV